MNHQINIDEAIAIAKEYHLEAEVTECIKQGMSPIEALFVLITFIKNVDDFAAITNTYDYIRNCKDTAILSFTLLSLNHTLQSVKIVVF